MNIQHRMKDKFQMTKTQIVKKFPLPVGERERVRGRLDHWNFGFVLRLGSGWRTSRTILKLRIYHLGATEE